MSVEWQLPWRASTGVVAIIIWSGVVLHADLERSESCVVSPHHAGLTFSVERIDPSWTCRLQSVIGNYTTVTAVGPIRAALSQSMYQYLLDHPPLAAALINRLDLGLYKSEMKGPGRFWGADGEGTEGMVQLVYQDGASRIYYLEGEHRSRLLPHIIGKAVVFLRMNAVSDVNGIEAMDSTMAAYTKLDNRILSGLVSILRPLIGGVVTRKLRKGVETVNRLGHTMNRQPERVLFEAMDQPALPDHDVAFLKQALRSQENLVPDDHRNRPTP